MRKGTIVPLAVLCAALGALSPLRLAGQEERAQTPNQDARGQLRLPGQPLGVQKDWEYKQIWPCQAAPDAEETASTILAEMNQLGRRGWELVSFAPVSVQQRRDCFVATFKRPLLH
jgi:hypothetical protein